MAVIKWEGEFTQRQSKVCGGLARGKWGHLTKLANFLEIYSYIGMETLQDGPASCLNVKALYSTNHAAGTYQQIQSGAAT